MRRELRVDFCKTLTKQPLPQIIFIGRWILGTQEHDSQASTIQFFCCGLNQKSEPEVLLKALCTLRTQKVYDGNDLVIVGHQIMVAFNSASTQQFQCTGIVCILNIG
jgi:hypothetical protein